MPTSVALSEHFEIFVKQQVSVGRFNNVSEVVRAGLRLLEDQEQLQALKLQELRTAIQAGAASGASVNSEQVFDRLERKYKDALTTAPTVVAPDAACAFATGADRSGGHR